MIKVLHLVGSMKRAGIETFIMNMFRKMDRNEFHFDFLCKDDTTAGDYDQEIIDNGSKILYVEYNKKGGKLKSIYNYLALKKVLKRLKNEYDIFHIHQYHAFDAYIPAKAAIDAGFKNIIIHSHSASADAHFKLHEMFKKKIHSLSLTRLSCSEGSGKWMYGEDNFIVIRNGIDTEKFKYDAKVRAEYRKKYSIEESDVVIGHVGRFFKVKNHSFLVDIFNEYHHSNPGSKLLLVGDGPDKEAIIQKCKELSLSDSVIFIPSNSNPSVYYQMMDIYIMPSIYEGVSLTAIEAETSGLPCLFSDTVTNDVDLLDSVKHISLNASLKTWNDAINDLLNMKNDRNQGKIVIRKAGYDINDSCTMLMNTYKTIVNSN